MSLIKKNLAANFAGNIWQILMGLAFVPLQIKFMGVESYGLVGIFATLQSIFVLLDMGLSATLTREMARLSVLPGKNQEMRNLVRSLELIYWCLAAFIGIVIVLVSPYLAHYWVKAGELSPQTIEEAIRIMGFAMAIQWPSSFYSGGLIGLQSLVLLNAINIGFNTFRGAGTVLILWLISPTIHAFFLWQILIGVINTTLLAFFLWHNLPRTKVKASFQKRLLGGIWRFSAGVGGTTALGLILTQMDKIILSRLLSLEAFGYYAFATTIAMGLYRLVGPTFTAFFPRLSQATAKDPVSLPSLYHAGCQTVAVLIIPSALILAIYSREILLVWTGNILLVGNVFPLLSILVIGNALNGLMYLPYALLLACGKTKLSLVSNAVAVALLGPTLYVFTVRYGAIGSAYVWLFLNLFYILVVLQIMHRVLLPAEKGRWYLDDLLKPLLAGLFIAGMGTYAMKASSSTVSMVALLLVLSAGTFTASALASPLIKTEIKHYVRSFSCSHHKSNPSG